MPAPCLADGESLTLAEAARTLPGRPNPSTLFRWQTRGVRGVRLETLLVGGRRFVTRAQLDRFFDLLNARAPQSQAADEAAISQGRRSSETAQRLKEAGLAPRPSQLPLAREAS